MAVDGCVQSTQTSSNPASVTGVGDRLRGLNTRRVTICRRDSRTAAKPPNSYRVEITHRAAVSMLALPRGFNVPYQPVFTPTSLVRSDVRPTKKRRLACRPIGPPRLLPCEILVADDMTTMRTMELSGMQGSGFLHF